MIKVINITNDPIAFYIGGVTTCASCQIRKKEISYIEPLLSNVAFYEINAHEAKILMKEQMIGKIPFFMITLNGKIQEIFYTYPSLEALYLKLSKLVRS